MGFKIKNSLTGEFEKLPILTLKGEKGETGGVEEYNKVDYMGNKYETLKQANDANVEYAVKTAIGEFNYLDYDGQHITATDTIAGQAKNAVLEGQTLVNLLDRNNMGLESLEYTFVDGIFNITTKRNWAKIKFKPALASNKKYILFISSSYKDCMVYYRLSDEVATLIGHAVNAPIIFTTPSEQIVSISIEFPTTVANETVSYPMLLEYQEGMENWDIPYFEGMASVKAPVLKTTGKNLLPPDKKWYPCRFKQGTTFKLSTKDSVPSNGGNIIFKDINGTYIWFGIDSGNTTSTKVLPCDVYYMNNSLATGVEHQLEIGTQATPFEPYKSNILSTPEEVVLRSLPNGVKDTLNLMSGEYVQRIGEITANELEPSDYYKSELELENTIQFGMLTRGREKLRAKTSAISVCNAIPIMPGNDDVFHARFDGGTPYGSFTIWMDKTKLETEDVFGLVKWLKDNNAVIQYELAEPIIKTVDLSDNHVYSYKDVTHYDCSSAEGSLVPTLSVKVPTDVQATIAQQRETIQTLNSENERLNQIQEALKASMLDSQVQLMNLSWDTDFEVFTLRESIAPKDFLLASRTGSNIDKFSQAKFIIENDCPDLEKLNSQIEYYFSKDVFSQEQFEELTDLISIVKGGNGCEY